MARAGRSKWSFVNF